MTFSDFQKYAVSFYRHEVQHAKDTESYFKRLSLEVFRTLNVKYDKDRSVKPDQQKWTMSIDFDLDTHLANMANLQIEICHAIGLISSTKAVKLSREEVGTFDNLDYVLGHIMQHDMKDNKGAYIKVKKFTDAYMIYRTWNEWNTLFDRLGKAHKGDYLKVFCDYFVQFVDKDGEQGFPSYKVFCKFSRTIKAEHATHTSEDEQTSLDEFVQAHQVKDNNAPALFEIPIDDLVKFDEDTRKKLEEFRTNPSSNIK